MDEKLSSSSSSSSSSNASRRGSENVSTSRRGSEHVHVHERTISPPSASMHLFPVIESESETERDSERV